DAVATRLVGVVDNLFDELRAIELVRLEERRRHAERCLDVAERILHDDGADGAADAYDEGGTAEHRADVTTFPNVAADDAGDGNDKTDKCSGTHLSSPRRSR